MKYLQYFDIPSTKYGRGLIREYAIRSAPDGDWQTVVASGNYAELWRRGDREIARINRFDVTTIRPIDGREVERARWEAGVQPPRM